MVNHSTEENSSITLAKEHRSSARIEGEPRYTKLKKIGLVVLALLFAGPLELLIILYLA
ncbi:MAG: hypothetical protein HeimC2_28080 [Candidatus Heimdallarchaeota archaeon LC_2]|nr:MAG: hypothetical protein HeimC2_28080 [Candidatus Heimdallarchaeota archaeon LC_2]